MIERFLGEDGRSRLHSVMKECKMFSGDDKSIDSLIKSGLMEEFDDGDIIIEQNGSDNDIYFIISGKVEVLINDRLVAERKSPNYIGEMSIVNPKETRSATVRANKKSVLLKVSEQNFIECANNHPTLWRNISIEISDRLKQRERFFRPKNERPVLFIGCSVEDLDIARAIQFNLEHDNVDTKIWTENIFIASNSTIDDLLTELKICDFGLFIITGNDVVETRNKKFFVPRDNVVLEIGLFMGKLGKNRVMMIKPRNESIKVPSDLLGLRLLDYSSTDTNLSSSLGSACFELRSIMNNLGAF